ncbi:alpha/beta hydrolase [Aquimarina longa]|uniref:alpha/beta hydrolase n=1 Tax=Aquimarina longa TaxID=1080221 RepID=UPI000780C787|nr:alpha/beta hydrolase-fold protein [Aquimarina longa]
MEKSIQNSIRFLFLIIGLVSLNSCEKENLSAIENNRPFYITSDFTNTKYSINVLYPPSYNSSNSYRTIYMLDGDDYFKEAADVIVASNKENIILIGIGYADKNRRGTDYSYPKDIDFPSASGGAKEFINFINQELIPHIENKIGIESSDRTLFGHSLGGYLALYITFQQGQLNPFDNIIAASSNFMWYNAYLFDLEQQYFDTQNTLNKSLYITVGDLEGASINLFFNAFKHRINERSYSGLIVNYERLKNISHRNSPIISFKKGVSVLLSI